VVRGRDTRSVITNVIIHLMNELPVMVDLEHLPVGGDGNVRCTNVRTVDGKRPQFVHDRNGVFIFPMNMIRLIEAPPGALGEQSLSVPGQTHPAHPALPPGADLAAGATGDTALVPVEQPEEELPDSFDEEPDEDLLARIRSV
jgi:hypothetical protein